ncbi:MAG: uncharacterized protein PWR08_1264 [Thermoanaerobacterium sp.]|nr:uncharacterized protein [Thermoanaerobacterium sp.]
MYKYIRKKVLSLVHTFSLNGYNFAVDGNSGAIHMLDNISYDMLKGRDEFPSYEEIADNLKYKYSIDEIKETYNELKELENQGLLFTSLKELEDSASHFIAKDSVKALCLHVSHDCNLRCEYCFASKGDYNTGRKLMSEEVAFKAVDYLVKNSTGRRNIEIDFFGGEPLLNFDVVKAIVNYGRSLEDKFNKKFYFTITTNGTLLDDEKIKFLNENMDNVVISIDGRKEIHDEIRHYASGNGSYDKIVPLAKKLVEERNGKSYFIRGTFTNKNKDFSRDVFHLADLGFKEISVEPVVGTGDEIYFDETDLQEILDEYENLAKLYVERLKSGKPFRFYHFNLNLYNGPCLLKRITACGAGYEYLAVSPEGDIYPCHQFVGQKEFIIGNINDGITNVEIKDKFKNNNIFAKEECKNCWAKLFCSGGCHANAYFTNKDISKPNEIACILQKKRIECAIMVQAALNE